VGRMTATGRPVAPTANSSGVRFLVAAVLMGHPCASDHTKTQTLYCQYTARIILKWVLPKILPFSAVGGAIFFASSLHYQNCGSCRSTDLPPSALRTGLSPATLAPMELLRIPYGIVKRVNHLAERAAASRALARRLQAANAVLAGAARPLKLNLGCGDVFFSGWVNVDLEDHRKANLVWNMTDRFPLPDECSSLIYSEHVIEHFHVDDGLKILRECRRLLAPGGVLRVAMPSLEYCVEFYVKDSWRPDFNRWEELRGVKTRCEALNVAMRWWGHLWLYDREELHRRLEEAGFNQIRDAEWGKSSVEELCNRETRAETFLIVEAVK
jgi:predicted SAM-dependent methyltransferase